MTEWAEIPRGVQARIETGGGSVEQRSGPGGASFEVRSVAPPALGTEPGSIAGYASVTGTAYRVGGRYGFDEIIMPGAFRDALAVHPDVHLLIDHAGLPLARTRSGTLQLAEDSTGLRIGAQLDATNPAAAGILSALRRGDVDEMSFAFQVPKGGDAWNSDYTKRTIRTVALDGGDVTITRTGANRATVVTARTTTLAEAAAFAEQSRARQRAMPTLAPDARRDRLVRLGLMDADL